ncbi:MAG: S1C family serine protease [Puniceicoccales bacterium]|jgi:S1-C subfamily serine protease|nr:S1C family serine protease [Puniceicoccales bacterium]
MGRVKTCFTFQFLLTLVSDHVVLGSISLKAPQVFDLKSSIVSNHTIFGNASLKTPQVSDLKSSNNQEEEDRILHPTTTISSNTVPEMLSLISKDVQAIWNARKNAVVQVKGNTKDEHGQNKLLSGTGFFVDANGHVLTTAAIAAEAENLWVDYNGLSYTAIVIGKDLTTNLAIIKLLKKPEHFQHIALQKFSSYECSQCGELVVFIGCVLGFPPAPNFGIVLGENITLGNRVFIVSYLRSNIEICGGESGAPVFDSLGNLCGVLIASLPEARSSFIIPSCILERIFQALLMNGTVKYSSAGFSVRSQMAISGKREIIISSLRERTPKDSTKDYLKIGDVISKIDGIDIREEKDIANLLFFRKPNETITLTVWRNNRTIEIPITLTEKTSEQFFLTT